MVLILERYSRSRRSGPACLAAVTQLLILMACTRSPYPPGAAAVRDISYGSGPENVLDIVRPPGSGAGIRPAVILVHGGGWRTGSRRDMIAGLADPLLAAGYIVVNMEYRKSPTAAAPAALEDVIRGGWSFLGNTAHWHADPEKVALIGVSAGAHLALMAAFTTPDAGFGNPLPVRAVVNYYGITDLAEAAEFAPSRDFTNAWLTPARREAALSLSPLTYVRAGLPAVLTIHSRADPVVPFSHGARLATMLGRAGVPAGLIPVDTPGHGFSQSQFAATIPAVLKFLREQAVTPPEGETTGPRPQP